MLAPTALLLAASSKADQVIVLARPSSFNSCPTWCEGSPTSDWSGSGSSSHSTAVGDNAVGCTFAYQGTPSITIQPTLAFNSVYQVDVTHISGNASPNIWWG